MVSLLNNCRLEGKLKNLAKDAPTVPGKRKIIYIYPLIILNYYYSRTSGCDQLSSVTSVPNQLPAVKYNESADINILETRFH